MEVVELPEEAVNTSRNTLFTIDDLDIDILPLIYEIIRSIEKDSFDTTQKAKESLDTSHKILEFQKKLDSVRSQIKRLRGIELSKEDQMQKLETLRKQLKLKHELLLKYRNMCTFEIPNRHLNHLITMVLRFLIRYLANNENLISKLAESKAMRRAAQLVVHILSKTNSMSGIHRLPSDPKEFGIQFKSIIKRFVSNVNEEIQDAKEKLKKN